MLSVEPSVELALLITQPERLTGLDQLTAEATARWGRAPTRLYFGNEFCHYLLPSPVELTRARAAARSAGLAFTLATPYLPDRALDELTELLPLLEAGDEVVINDWGVLRRLRSAAPTLLPVVGRLMNKILRDHRTPEGEAPALNPGQASVEDRSLAQTGLAAGGMRALLGRLGVARVEFDWGPRGFLWEVAEVAASVYLPFGYVASGRVCPLASLDRPREEKFTVDPPTCPRPCRRFRLELRGAGVGGAPLLHVGNTVFYEVAQEGVAAAHQVVARIPGGRVVWQPELPM